MFKKILSHTLFALIGAVAGSFVVTSLAYCIPDLGFIIRNAVEDDWSTEDIGTALDESFERWN